MSPAAQRFIPTPRCHSSFALCADRTSVTKIVRRYVAYSARRAGKRGWLCQGWTTHVGDHVAHHMDEDRTKSLHVLAQEQKWNDKEPRRLKIRNDAYLKECPRCPRREGEDDRGTQECPKHANVRTASSGGFLRRGHPVYPHNTGLSGKAGLQRLPAKRAHRPALSVPTLCYAARVDSWSSLRSIFPLMLATVSCTSTPMSAAPNQPRMK